MPEPAVPVASAKPALGRLLHHVPREVVDSFTPEQLRALGQAVAQSQMPRQHRVEVRRTLSLLGRKYYLVVLLGKDHRTRRRLQMFKKQRPNSAVMTGLSTAIAAILLAAVGLSSAYILISGAIGIEPFPDRPPLDVQQLAETSAPESEE